MDLTPARRRELKARAHSLEPVVMIGDKGLSPAVLKEIDVNLNSHELIKIRVAGDDRALRESFLRQVCAALAASLVQHIGKILVIYRENPEQQRTSASARAVATKRAARPTRTAAGKSRSASRTK